MPKKKLIEQYSLQDLMHMSILGGMIIYNIIPDMHTDKQRYDIMRNLYCTELIRNNPDKIGEMFGKQLKDVNSFLHKDDADLNTAIKNNPGKSMEDIKEAVDDNNQAKFNENYNQLFEVDTKSLENVTLDRRNFNNFKRYYTGEAMEQPIRLMVNTMKKISKDLGQYIKDKENSLADDEKAFLNGIQKLVDDLASGKGINNKLNANPSYLHTIYVPTMYIKLDKPQIVYEHNAETDQYSFKVSGVSGPRNKIDWKTVLNINYSNGIIGSFNTGIKLETLRESYISDGDVDREQLIKGYEDYVAELSKELTMTEDGYELAKRTLDVKMDDITGQRSLYFVLDDAKAHISLLKAGYPLSDTSVMAQYYNLIQECKRKAEKDNNEQAKDVYESAIKLWDEAVSPKSVDKSFRDEMLEKMAANVSDISNVLPGYGKLADMLREQKTARLTANDIAELNASPKVLYKLIDKADPIYISSSEQFKEMKEALEKLSKIDKERDPAGYDLWRERAIGKTEAYVKFKNKQLHDPKEKHSRSSLEIKRVKAANAVLKGLKAIRKSDIDNSLATDKRHIAGEELAYKPAVEFMRAQGIMFQIRKEMLKELTDIKAILVSSQKSDRANFEFEAKEGSEEYRRMTQSLEKSINTLENPKASPNDVIAAVSRFHEAATAYHKEKEGILFDPQTKRGQLRFDQSYHAMTTLPFLVQVHENARRQFENFRDKDGNSYMQKPYGEIEEISDKLIDKYEHSEELKNDHSKWDWDGEYINIKEVSKLQMSVTKIIEKKNEFMKENYSSNKDMDYYTAVEKGMSVSGMAKNYITKQYLDRLYSKDVSRNDIEEIRQEIKAGELEKRSSELASNVVFKAVAKTYQEKAFSEWNRIEKRADKIQGMCGDNLNSLHRGVNRKYNNADEYINSWEDRERKINAAAHATVNEMMATVGNKTARLIAQSLAADSSVKPEDEIERLVSVGAKYLDEQQKKTGMDINVIRKDPKVIKSLDKKILESYNTAAKQRKEAAKVKAKAAARQADSNRSSKAPQPH